MKRATMAPILALIAVAPLMGTDGCVEWSEWSQPVPLEGINTASTEASPVLSDDSLSLYFQSNRPGGAGGNDIWAARREKKSDPWGAPFNLGSAINTAADDAAPSLSKDGRLLFFQSNRSGGFGGNDLYVSRRTDEDDDFDWETPEHLGADVNTSANEQQAHFQKMGEDGLPTLYFNRDADLYTAPMTKEGQSLGPAVALSELNSDSIDAGVTVSKYGLELFFHSDRAGTLGFFDLMVSTRPSVHDDWSAPQNLGATVNSTVADFAPSLSSDGRTLLFSSSRAGGSGLNDIWMSTRTLVAVDD